MQIDQGKLCELKTYLELESLDHAEHIIKRFVADFPVSIALHLTGHYSLETSNSMKIRLGIKASDQVNSRCSSTVSGKRVLTAEERSMRPKPPHLRVRFAVVILSDSFVLVALCDMACAIAPICVAVGFFGISLPLKL